MNNRYHFWIACLVSLLTWGLTSCNKFSCEFSYSPTVPRAGQSVTFVNESVGADDYYWTFGDNTTSTTSSPSHIYRKPGKYTVTLQIIRNKVDKRHCTHEITVGDTIPAIAISTDSICTYTPITFYADVYNPWKKTLHYQWTLPEEAVVLDGQNLDSSAVVCYFQRTGDATVYLDLQMGDSLFRLDSSIAILHQEAPSVLYLTGEKVYEQFIYTVRQQVLYTEAHQTTDSTNMAYIQQEQDSIYIYGDTLTIDQVRLLLSDATIQGFQVDRLKAKLYAYGSKGLYVRNLIDERQRQLVNLPVRTIKVDGGSNRLYWATEEGLFTSRLLQLNNNEGDFQPNMLNSCASISRISVNPYKH